MNNFILWKLFALFIYLFIFKAKQIFNSFTNSSKLTYQGHSLTESDKAIRIGKRYREALASDYLKMIGCCLGDLLTAPTAPSCAFQIGYLFEKA